MSHAEIFLEGVRYISTREAARVTGLSQNYVSKICKSGFANAKIVRGIWYVDEASLAKFLEQQAIERDRWHQRLSETRQAERSASRSYATGAAAITVHPRALHKYHADRKARKKLRSNIALASASLFIVALTSTQIQLNSLTSSTQFAAASNAFISLQTSLENMKLSLNPKPQVIYVGVLSPTMVSDISSGVSGAGINSSSTEQEDFDSIQDNIQIAVSLLPSDAAYIPNRKLFAYTIDVTENASSTTLQDFAKQAYLGAGMSSLNVTATPAFNGTVHYELHEERRQIVIFATKKGSISVLLTAPRQQLPSRGNVEQIGLIEAPNSTSTRVASTTENALLDPNLP